METCGYRFWDSRLEQAESAANLLFISLLQMKSLHCPRCPGMRELTGHLWEAAWGEWKQVPGEPLSIEDVREVLLTLTVVLAVFKSSRWVVNSCKEKERGRKECETEKQREKQRVARPQRSSPGRAVQKRRPIQQQASLGTVTNNAKSCD